MEVYTPENSLELLKLCGNLISPDKFELIKTKFNEFYDISGKGYDFVDATWKSALDIISTNTPEGVILDMSFQERIIDSGIAKKIREGTPLSDLIH